MKQKTVKNNDPWMLAEDIPDMDFFFSQIWLQCFVNNFAKNTGRAYSKILCRYEGYHLWFYFGAKDSYEVAENIVNRIVNEVGYAESINKNIVLEADKLRKYSKTIPQKNLNKLTNQQLWKIYKTHNDIHTQYYTWCWIPVAADMFHNNLTKRLKQYLRDNGVEETKINKYFVILTQPTKKSLIFIEQQELLKIGVVIEKDKKLIKLFQKNKAEQIIKKLPNNILNLFNKHCSKYYYTKHLWVTGEYIVTDYIKQLKDVFVGGISPSILIKKQENDLKKAITEQNKLIKKLKLEKKWQKIFLAFGDFMVTKIYRRYAQIFAVYQMDRVLKEIAKRKLLTEKQIRFMTPAGVKEMLLNDKYNEKELSQRAKDCVCYTEKKYQKIYIGRQAEKILKKVNSKIDKNITTLSGEIGCPGSARGIVKVIIRAKDMAKMNDGDILVSIATDPDIVPAMKRAAAIVTEQGGVTSHAAIVSRELGIPCVIGTKIATQVLKDGDLVEVDANRGFVKIINKI